ncbi:MAG: Yip1 family protein [Caldiserica bacterium]|nr:Yip1 family protein [Caldisericota bacterium]
MKKIKKILWRIWAILRQPSKTYQKVYNEGLGESMLYFLTILAILAVVMLALGTVFLSLFISRYFEDFPLIKWVSLPSLAIFIPVSGFVLLAISGLTLHLFVRLLGGKQGLRQTFKACTYASTPFMLSLWFPPLFVVTVVWSLILTWIGIRELQKMTTAKAIMSVLLPNILIITAAYIMKILL